MAVEITRTELSASELRAAAGATRDGRAARRMLAIALVLEGADGQVRRGAAAWTGRPYSATIWVM